MKHTPLNGLARLLSDIEAEAEEVAHSKMMDRRAKEAMRKSQEGCTLDTDNSFDGDGGREHSDYMRDNGSGT